MSVAELQQPEAEKDRLAAVEETERIALRESVAESATPGRMYQFARFLHVGPHAEACEEGEKGTCADPLHFHAWLRLPNKFQHKDLRDKGLAAKARAMRAMRNPESDAHAILEERLDALRDPDNLAAVVEEVAAKDWSQDYLTAVTDLADQEDDAPADTDEEQGEPARKWAHIDQDRERYQRLGETELAKPEEEQSAEFKELTARIGLYIDALRARVEEIQEPKKVALTERGLDGVIDVLRKQRIEDEGDAAFIHTYNEWMWFIGTLKPVESGYPHERVWNDIGHVNDPKPGTMWAAAPEVIEAVEGAFQELDAALQQAARGNS